MKKTFFLLFALLLSHIAVAKNLYCNARFRFCIEYPSMLIPKEVSANGDGAVFFYRKHRATITASAMYNVLHDNFAQWQAAEKKDNKKHHPSYEKVGKNSYTVSYKKGDTIIYIRSIYLPKEEAIASFYAEYPSAEQKDMAPIIKMMALSLQADNHQY